MSERDDAGLSEREIACLRDIEKQNGRLDEEIVLEEARDKRSPLHDRFAWNDPIAAYRYRQRQAQEVLRLYKAVKLTKHAPQRSPRPVSVKVSAASQRPPARRTGGEVELACHVAGQLSREITRLIASYERFSHVTGIANGIAQLRAAVADLDRVNKQQRRLPDERRVS